MSVSFSPPEDTPIGAVTVLRKTPAGTYEHLATVEVMVHWYGVCRVLAINDFEGTALEARELANSKAKELEEAR